MKPRYTGRADLGPRDAGISLIEVLVAITIIAIVAGASATLTINGLSSAAGQTRRQVAVTIASGSLESVSARSLATNAASGVSSLYDGRYLTTVTSAWTSNLSESGVPQTYPVWDKTSTALSAPVVPLTTMTTQSNTDFTVLTLIGKCYQPKNGGDCALLPGYANTSPFATPTVSPAAYFPMIRVIVIVRWNVGTGCTTAPGCSYTASTLFDPSSDLEWVTHD